MRAEQHVHEGAQAMHHHRFAFVFLASCAVSPTDPADETSPLEPDIATTSVLSRAEEWVHAELHYCQSPNHERDFDSACSTYCERHDNATWDPYRSDCSGFVSWAWGLGAPGRTTLGFAPFETDITHTIEAIDLKPGDAINNSDHIMLFKEWVDKGHRALFLEEPGCSSATPYAHQVDVDVSINGRSIYVPYNGMTFTAIHFDGIHNAAPAVDSDRIGVTSWKAGRLDLFARNDRNRLVHRYRAATTGDWSDWESLGGDLGSSPAAVSWAENRIDVFAEGTNAHLLHTWFDGSWHDFEDLGGSLSSPPTVISSESGSLDVFVRDAQDQLAHKYFRPGTGWSGWQQLGGNLAGTPAAIVPEAGRIEVFARNADNNVLHISHGAGGWSAWGTLEGPIHAGPGVASWGGGRIDLFGSGADQQLLHRWYDKGKWSEWQGLGGSLASPPTAVSWGEGRIDIFARGGNDLEVHKYWTTANQWSDWVHEGTMAQ